MKFQYGQDHLTLNELLLIADKEHTTDIDSALTKLAESRARVELMAQGDSAVYGINTGFGPLCDTQISPSQTETLQHNLLISHAVGVGAPISSRLSRIMLIAKVHALSRGYSGVRVELVERLLYFLEHDMIPVVPCQGSVGASGDLAPLSHLFLPLIGEGSFWNGETEVEAASLLSEHNLAPLSLQAKEGLALINGTQFILAHAVLGLDRMRYLLNLADVVGTMSLEGYQGSSSPFRSELHDLRPFAGSLKVAERIRQLLEGSQNLASHENCGRVQDPYSFRCMPQVHGASRNAYNHLLELAEIEMNAVTDNPIVISETEAISGGNFHGQPLAMALDYASIAAAELGNISDRRCYALLEGKYGLPRFLTDSPGLNSGLMIPQYTTAALVTENKSLCFPPSADSVPTSLGQEDHVSMGSISGRKFNQILGNLEQILAIELLYASQAIEFRRPNTCGSLIEKNMEIIRSKVPRIKEDRLLKNDIDALIQLVRDRKILVEI